MTLEEMQKKLRAIKNKNTFGLDITNDMVKLVKANPIFVMNTLADIVDYYIDQINKLNEVE
jgi:hypothetical protein